MDTVPVTLFHRHLEDKVTTISRLTTYINDIMLVQLFMEGKDKINRAKWDLVHQGDRYRSSRMV